MMNNLKGKWALVTGASSGIGMDLARLLAQSGCNVVITARRVERLQLLKEELELAYNVQIEAIANDLSQIDGASKLFDAVEERQLPISVLVNNAGIGLNGQFTELALEDQMGMIQLNLNSLTELTHRFLAGMQTRNEGWILQVASTYAFQPGAGYAAYAASKAYVLSFSLALNHELRGSNIKHSALCPGPTRTEFFEVAGNTSNPFMNALMLDSKEVAELGFRAVLVGKPFVVPGFINRLFIFTQRLVPRSVVVAIAAMFGK
jgi:short-subunit dehydrogenase